MFGLDEPGARTPPSGAATGWRTSKRRVGGHWLKEEGGVILRPLDALCRRPDRERFPEVDRRR